MKVIDDVTTDVPRIIFKDVPVEDYSDNRPGVTVDYDVDDNMIAIEIQNASKLVDDPQATEHIIVSEII